MTLEQYSDWINSLVYASLNPSIKEVLPRKLATVAKYNKIVVLVAGFTFESLRLDGAIRKNLARDCMKTCDYADGIEWKRKDKYIRCHWDRFSLTWDIDTNIEHLTFALSTTQSDDGPICSYGIIFDVKEVM